MSCPDGTHKYKEYNKLSERVYMYSMEDEKQKILVVCSFWKKTISFAPPNGFDLDSAKAILLSCERPKRWVLSPYGARVYLWEK